MYLFNFFLAFGSLFLFQDSNNNKLTGRFSGDAPLNIIEKVYLQTDRDRYTAGEDLYFKAYLVDASSKLLTDHSSSLHVDLIAPGNDIIASRIVRLGEGLGKGDFSLPKKLASGSYHLRAYTNYMRNFSDALFFDRTITVVGNTPDNSNQDSATTIKNKIDITFFPEGGSLVEDVESDVAFKAVNALGEGISVEGTVFTVTGDSVTSFSSSHKGMGLFRFTPRQGTEYRILTTDGNGNTATSVIPDVFKTGYVMHIQGNPDEGIEIVIRTNGRTFSERHEKDLTLSLSEHGNMISATTFRLNALNNVMNIESSEIPAGIVMFTLSEDNVVPEAERLFFVNNPAGYKIGLKTDRQTYSTRDSVALQLSLSADDKTPQTAFLSMSAFDEVSGEDLSEYPVNIASWFLLESEVRGKVEEPSYYFDINNPAREKDLNLLLLTQGWRDFRWKYKDEPFRPEHGFTVSGRVRNKFADEPVSNATVTVSVFSEAKPLTVISSTDSTGRFSIDNLDLTGKARLIASVSDDRDRLKGWLLLDSIHYSPSPAMYEQVKKMNLIQPEKTGETKKDTAVQQDDDELFRKFTRDNLKKMKDYTSSDTIPIGEVTIKARNIALPEPAKMRAERYLMTLFPDIEYPMEKNIQVYNNLGQLLILRFRLKFSGTDPLQNTDGLVGQTMSKVPGQINPEADKSDSAPKQGFQTDAIPGSGSSSKMKDPILILDGAIVEFGSISMIPADWVDRIDILYPINAQFVWGERGKHGVVSIILKDDAQYRDRTKYFHSVNVRIAGYDEARIFYSSKHNKTSEDNKKPDLRTTLFWSPDIILKKNGSTTLSWFNCDNPATVRIKVEGITSDGVPPFATGEYEVR